jgi:xylulokinase
MEVRLYFIGIDLGTSGLRAILVDQFGNFIASSESKYEVSNPKTGWSEQNPEDWKHACKLAFIGLRENFPKEISRLKSIGVAGHMHGAVLLDDLNKPLRPCILWNDARSYKEAQNLDSLPKVRDVSGNIVFPGFTAPKLMWVKNNEPDLFQKIKTVVLPAGYLNTWLIGAPFADMSDSAGTSWLDVKSRKWSEHLIVSSDMQIDQMPELVEGNQIAGKIQGDLASELGFPNDVMIVGGAGDNAAAACGVGAIQEGEGLVSLGTSGVLLISRDRCKPFPDAAVHTFCHAIPEKWYQMGVILSATDSINWLSQISGKTALELDQLLPNEPTGPANEKFFPYLSGERTPLNDAHIRAGFAGLGQTSDLEKLTQCVMEGVAFALRDCLEAIKKTGTSPSSLLATGGGSASQFWLQTISNTLNIEIEKPKTGEFGAALGAARLAITAIIKEPIEKIMTKPEIERKIMPNQKYVNLYQTAYEIYKKGHVNLRGLQ